MSCSGGKSTKKGSYNKANNLKQPISYTIDKKGDNNGKYYTTFINIQQVTKAGEFAGSNRLKHMTDAMCHVERSKDGLARSLHFSKNRDCDKDFKMYFTIYNDSVHYSYETTND